MHVCILSLLLTVDVIKLIACLKILSFQWTITRNCELK